jgi:hypothetical protein
VDTKGRRDRLPDASASETHDTQIVVWDVPPAIERCARFSFKAGIKCAQACCAQGWSVGIRDEAGRVLTRSQCGENPLDGTSALYYCELELGAPDTDGTHAWEAYVPAMAGEGHDAIAHPAASMRFNVRVVPAAQFGLKVIAVDARTRVPVKGARVVVHPYRTSTGDDGVAELRVPKGAYRVFVSDRRYYPFRSDSEIERDMTILAELDADTGVGDAELWG